MNALAIVNLARRYAKNYVARRFPDLPKAEASAMVKTLAAMPKWRALARINLSRAA